MKPTMLKPNGQLMVISCLLLLWVVQHARAEFQLCNVNYCLHKTCVEYSCKGSDKILMHNVSQCGCCNICVQQLKEKDSCTYDIMGKEPNTQCGPHLRCYKKNNTDPVCTKISDIESKGCEAERASLLQNPSKGILSHPVPECDQYGDYEARQCKNGTLCHCVDLNNKPIFGTSIYNKAKDMNCHCARQFANTNDKLRELGSLPLEPINYLRCKSNGNFEPFQYYGNYTYCVDEKSGQIKERAVLREHAKGLSCFKQRYGYKTECIRKYNSELQKKWKLEKENGQEVVSYDLPRCDLDGSYAPVQCTNDKCYCVNKQGVPYRGLQVDRTDPYFAFNQQCTCARHLELIRDITKRDKVTEMYSRYQCDKNGNYLPLQCSSSECYCVDPLTGYVDTSHGSLLSALKMDIGFIVKLPCFVNYPDSEKQRLIDIFNLK